MAENAKEIFNIICTKLELLKNQKSGINNDTHSELENKLNKYMEFWEKKKQKAENELKQKSKIFKIYDDGITVRQQLIAYFLKINTQLSEIVLIIKNNTESISKIIEMKESPQKAAIIAESINKNMKQSENNIIITPVNPELVQKELKNSSEENISNDAEEGESNNEEVQREKKNDTVFGKLIKEIDGNYEKLSKIKLIFDLLIKKMANKESSIEISKEIIKEYNTIVETISECERRNENVYKDFLENLDGLDYLYKEAKKDYGKPESNLDEKLNGMIQKIKEDITKIKNARKEKLSNLNFKENINVIEKRKKLNDYSGSKINLENLQKALETLKRVNK